MLFDTAESQFFPRPREAEVSRGALGPPLQTSAPGTLPGSGLPLPAGSVSALTLVGPSSGCGTGDGGLQSLSKTYPARRAEPEERLL